MNTKKETERLKKISKAVSSGPTQRYSNSKITESEYNEVKGALDSLNKDKIDLGYPSNKKNIKQLARDSRNVSKEGIFKP